MRKPIVVICSMIIAAGLVAAAISLVMGGIRLFPLTFVVVAVLAFVLGLPLYLAAHTAGRATLIRAALAGFFVGGAIPALLVLSGPVADSASVGGTATVVGGVYTVAGWLKNLGMVLAFGAAGAIGGIAFWAIVGGRDDTAKVGNVRMAILVGAAACVLVAASTTTSLTMDRSCHNPLRNGSTSISPIASFTLLAGKDHWPKVEAILEEYQRSNDWAIRSDVRLGDDFPWFQVSVCEEPGTQIFASGYLDFGGRDEVRFDAFTFADGAEWEDALRSIHNAVESQSLGELEYKHGEEWSTEPPAWLSTGEEPPGRTDARETALTN
ncbi:MAG: hypothetical protein AAGB23_00240 [Pseudomonadota bacterium]